MKLKISKTRIFILVGMLIVIAATGIITHQEFITMLPLFFSLFIMLFQSDANRYAYLAGSLNSILYAAVYFFYIKTYANAASSLFFSFPVQLLTFLNWKRNAYRESTKFKKMSNPLRIICAVLFFGIWIVSTFVLNKVSSSYAILDSASSILGIAVSILTMLAYIEYSYIWLASAMLSIGLNVAIFVGDPSKLTYLIYSLYSFGCVVMAFINVRKLYREQCGEKTREAVGNN